MLFSSQLISNAEQDVLRKLGKSYTNCGIDRNYMFRTKVTSLLNPRLGGCMMMIVSCIEQQCNLMILHQLEIHCSF